MADSKAKRIRNNDDITAEDVENARELFKDPDMVKKFNRLSKAQARTVDIKKKRELEVLLGKFGSGISKRDLQGMVSTFWKKEAQNKVTSGASETLDALELESILGQYVSDADRKVIQSFKKGSKTRSYLTQGWSFGQKVLVIPRGNDPFVDADQVSLFTSIAKDLESNENALTVFIGMLLYAKIELRSFAGIDKKYINIFNKIEKVVDAISWNNIRTVFDQVGVPSVSRGDKNFKAIQSSMMKVTNSKDTNDLFATMLKDVRINSRDDKTNPFDQPKGKSGKGYSFSKAELDFVNGVPGSGGILEGLSYEEILTEVNSIQIDENTPAIDSKEDKIRSVKLNKEYSKVRADAMKRFMKSFLAGKPQTTINVFQYLMIVPAMMNIVRRHDLLSYTTVLKMLKTRPGQGANKLANLITNPKKSKLGLNILKSLVVRTEDALMLGARTRLTNESLNEGKIEVEVKGVGEDIKVEVGDRRVASLLAKLLTINGFETFIQGQTGVIDVTPKGAKGKTMKALVIFLKDRGYEIKK